MDEFTIRPIGTIHTPHKNKKDAPIQPGYSTAEGKIVLFPEFKLGLKKLDGFSHLILLYYFHRAKHEKLEITPFLDKETKGIFATRFNERPNKIGLSVVILDRIEDNILYIRNIDVLDNTPLLDIKPLVPDFDLKEIETCKIGWLQNKSNKQKTS